MINKRFNLGRPLDGHATSFSGGSWKESRNAMIIACDNKMGTLYMMNDDEFITAIVKSQPNFELWHCQLSHMSEK